MKKSTLSNQLRRVRLSLLNHLNYYTRRLSAGRVDILVFVQVLHDALVSSGVYLRYDDIHDRWEIPRGL